MSRKRWKGRSTDDPFVALSPDTAVHTITINCPPVLERGLHNIDDWNEFNGIHLSIHFYKDDWNTIEGSAVMVAPGIAFTAFHVFDCLLEQLVSGQLNTICVGYTSFGPRIWRIRHLTRPSPSDLLILSLELASEWPKDNGFPQAGMSIRVPDLGELVVIHGFRAAPGLIEAKDDIYFPLNGELLQASVAMLCAVGEVSEIHLEGRGAIAPGPGFEVARSVPGGLSGGGVFDRNGDLIGILTSSLDDPENTGHSRVSLLWPGLMTPFPPSLNSQNLPARMTLLDFRDSTCLIKNREAVQISPETGSAVLDCGGD